MKIRILLVSGCLAVLALSGCQEQVNSDAVKDGALLKTDKAFSEMSAQKGFADAFSHYALADAILLPQGSMAVKGKLQIAQSLAAIPADTRISWTPRAAAVSHKLGYTWGIYTSAGTTANGQATVAYGKYLSVWKRQHGDWKLTLTMTNQSPGPAG